MPFKKGVSGNPHGMGKVKHVALKWAEIDEDIAKAAKFIATVVEGTDEDLINITDPRDRLEIKLKAVTALLRLAPQRQVGSDGEKLDTILVKFVNG